jgi:hypothetical protein
MDSKPKAFGHEWKVADQVAFWDGCRQTLEEADNRVQQYVSSVLTYIPALAAAGLSVLAVSTASSYYLGYIAGLLIGVAGLGMTLEAKSQADPAFGTLQGAIDVTGRVEELMHLPDEVRMSIQIGVAMNRISAPGRPPELRKRFDLLCYGMLAAFTVIIALSLLGLYIRFGPGH